MTMPQEMTTRKRRYSQTGFTDENSSSASSTEVPTDDRFEHPAIQRVRWISRQYVLCSEGCALHTAFNKMVSAFVPYRVYTLRKETITTPDKEANKRQQ